MHRDPPKLADRIYDLVIIGGGINGACLAWDAALRGLSVALVEQGDFGHATSANSLKTIHGGLRYLQDGNLRLVRMMIQERMIFTRIAPHLVHPLPCLMPTYPRLMRSKAVMGVALTLNDLVGFDRNRGADPQKHLPRGRILSRDECLQILPGIADPGVTGAALWYDCQVHNTERLTLAFVQSAVALGAQVANYVKATGFLRKGNQVTGIHAQDLLSGEALAIRARLTINAAGPWSNQLMGQLDPRSARPLVRPSSAMNIVTRQIIAGYAAGIPSYYEVKRADGSVTRGSRLLFVAPWRNYSIIGTDHTPYAGSPDEYTVTEEEVERFLQEVNCAYPGAQLKREDVYLVHRGILPVEEQAGVQDDPHNVKLVREGRVHDHLHEKIEGLISVVGVKYTMARKLAQQAIDLACRKLDQQGAACKTTVAPVWGGQIGTFTEYVANAIQDRPTGLAPETVRRLICNYGSAYPALAGLIRRVPELGEPLSGQSAVTAAEVLYAVREEMAQTLADVVFRRTELGSAGHPGDEALQASAAIMAAEMQWDQARIQQEIEDVNTAFGVCEGHYMPEEQIPVEV
jgi:glycerol-3-phosphate dehydrogenase